MSARRRALTLYSLAAEELERAGDDRAKAVTALTHQLHADDSGGRRWSNRSFATLPRARSRPLCAIGAIAAAVPGLNDAGG